ncbi:hypothetical protein FY034_08280 [Trichlorobacter lovleyi]|uniref:hypothetical protein n=1 Tax=Trichlorobacter lovleyi TaxID=313985 RepID=UPI002240A2E8|nr:hypothetical protein [Trichlorobacter lovleyi]QOX78931.1 hypothetical protein FY034_08280 [Trichlorobacter lovleyi]
MKKKVLDDEVQAVDFSGAVRGKHSAIFQRGHAIKIHHDDGSVTVQKTAFIKSERNMNDPRRSKKQDHLCPGCG